MFNLWLNVVTEFSEKWYVRKYFYMLQILTTAIKQRLYSTTGCITQQIQLIIKYKTHFVRVIKCRQFFCAPDIFLYVPENSDHVQPVVVFCCKHNVTMRILNKTQLILESNLDFRGGQYHPNEPKSRNITRGWSVSEFFDACNALNAAPPAGAQKLQYVRIRKYVANYGGAPDSSAKRQPPATAHCRPDIHGMYRK